LLYARLHDLAGKKKGAKSIISRCFQTIIQLYSYLNIAKFM